MEWFVLVIGSLTLEKLWNNDKSMSPLLALQEW